MVLVRVDVGYVIRVDICCQCRCVMLSGWMCDVVGVDVGCCQDGCVLFCQGGFVVCC